MSIKGIKIELNSAGIKELLQSQQVRAEMDRRARKVAAAAGPGNSVNTFVGRDRARSTVYTETAEAKRAEAENRALTRALDAARE